MTSPNEYRQEPPPDIPASDAWALDGDDEPAPDSGFEVRRAFVGPAWHGWRLDRVLVQLAPEFSRGHLQGLVEAGCVRLNGTAATRNASKLQAGQRLEVELRPTAQSLAFRPEPLALDIVFEDEHLVVIAKPAGLVVHPAAGHWSGTLLNGLLARYPESAVLPRAGIVHRLDKDTSGLMVVGKTLAATTALSQAIARREVDRIYMAIVHGSLRAGAFDVDAPVGRDPTLRTRMAVVACGRSARTTVEPVPSQGELTAVHCRLHSGRTHQIRVHLAHRGHPLLGDSLYGGRVALGMQRQALHAQRLSLVHPARGHRLECRVDPPPDLQHAWDRVVSPTYRAEGAE